MAKGEKVMEEKEEMVVAPTPKAVPEEGSGNPPVRVGDEPKIGLINRKNHSITVSFKKDSTVLSAGGRTGLDYFQKDIKAVNGMTLKQAVAKGVCAILR